VICGHWVADYNSDLRSILSNSTSNIRVAPPEKKNEKIIVIRETQHTGEDTGFFKERGMGREGGAGTLGFHIH